MQMQWFVFWGKSFDDEKEMYLGYGHEKRLTFKSKVASSGGCPTLRAPVRLSILVSPVAHLALKLEGINDG